jgi:hypothetical protein
MSVALKNDSRKRCSLTLAYLRSAYGEAVAVTGRLNKTRRRCTQLKPNVVNDRITDPDGFT